MRMLSIIIAVSMPLFTLASCSTYHIENPHMRPVMDNCSNLFYLSTIACKLAECLPEKELAALSADLVTLSDMLANLIAHRDLCSENNA